MESTRFSPLNRQGAEFIILDSDGCLGPRAIVVTDLVHPAGLFTGFEAGDFRDFVSVGNLQCRVCQMRH